jgi:conjugative transfer signal peptidase TraF
VSDGPLLGLRRWGEELRRLRAGRRRERRRLWAAAAASSIATALLLSLSGACRPLLVWNATDSSPRGLYVIGPPGRIEAGETVLAWPPPAARRLAAARNYLPASVPLVKRVAAAAGDRACADGRSVAVNGSVRALVRAADGAGRPLTSWRGCVALNDGQVLLMSPAPAAFDGRYFGVTRREDVIGRARRLWPR